MAEFDNEEEQAQPALHSKRKPDPKSEDDQTKRQKLEISDNNASPSQDKASHDGACSVAGGNYEDDDDDDDDDDDEEVYEDEDTEDDEDEEEEEEEEEGDDDEEDGEDSSRNRPELDRKGKGILRDDDKGKGKLIAEEESEDDGDDSDLSEDPLAEVDLNNILPSRTRGRVIRPGIYLANDPGHGRDNSDT
ncbi:phosphopantothenoylcysteine decarboxylase subunit VHS3 [Malania oleifera]|uniref:phosphopantothenoylcysteine decarboxylase subunit VHS3 n=1 Tax=Malania oleifera TaxID=397392 RepID=UPI0025AE90A9|nr:phosphopantothenoylcysteine decarboxylase subunit VHS3 [Malania oleifera]